MQRRALVLNTKHKGVTKMVPVHKQLKVAMKYSPNTKQLSKPVIMLTEPRSHYSVDLITLFLSFHISQVMYGGILSTNRLRKD